MRLIWLLLAETETLCYRADMSAPLITILNGPNLNLLGSREPEIYGTGTLDDLETLCGEVAEGLGLAIDFRQSNLEGELISWVQEARGRAAGLIINPAGYSHTSIALMDALLALDIPVMEVHLSNIFTREPFRHHSYVSRASQGVICGLGFAGYRLGLIALSDILEEDQ
jgi:3-dehydroquinate dehydratase-2